MARRGQRTIMSIRTRLTFLYTSLLATVILMFSAATSGVLNWTLRHQVDNTLLDTYRTVQETASADINGDLRGLLLSNLSLRPDLFWQVWVYNKQYETFHSYGHSWNIRSLDTAALDVGALGTTQEVRHDVELGGNHLRVATYPLIVNGQRIGNVQVGSSLRTVDAAISRLLKIMLIGGAVTLLASLILGDFLTRRALQPIDTIAQAARQITAADDLSRRIPYDGPPDEIGQLTHTFNETLGRLERLFNVQRRFVADVSHEMRTPLTIIQGNLDLMQRVGYDPEAMEAIQAESQRMSRLVDALLMLAKADAGRLTLSKTLVDLETLVREVFHQAQVLSRGEIEVVLGQIEHVSVLVDCDRIKQLLLNLVSNALKYTDVGGRVILSITRTDGTAQVHVADTGIGIPAEDLPRIFDRFYRVDKARSRAMGGTGLGLAIARWIAEAHDGQLSVTSEVGKGSTFTLSLPLISEQVRQSAIRQTIPNMRSVRLPLVRR